MKYLLVFVCVFAACRAEVDKEFVKKFVEKIKKISEECIAETKATQEDVKTLLSHKIPESHEGKCLLFCYHRHFHVQSEDGSLTKAEAIAALDHFKEHNVEVYEKIVKVFNTCADTAKPDNDPCIFASHLTECAINEGKSFGLDELMVTH